MKKLFTYERSLSRFGLRDVKEGCFPVLYPEGEQLYQVKITYEVEMPDPKVEVSLSTIKEIREKWMKDMDDKSQFGDYLIKELFQDEA